MSAVSKRREKNENFKLIFVATGVEFYDCTMLMFVFWDTSESLLYVKWIWLRKSHLLIKFSLSWYLIRFLKYFKYFTDANFISSCTVFGAKYIKFNGNKEIYCFNYLCDFWSGGIPQKLFWKHIEKSPRWENSWWEFLLILSHFYWKYFFKEAQVQLLDNFHFNVQFISSLAIELVFVQVQSFLKNLSFRQVIVLRRWYQVW